MTTNDRRGHGHRARLAVVVLGLLLGLLGMHALSLHGANASLTASHVSQVASHDTGVTASHAGTEKAAHTAATDNAGHDGGMSGHDGHDGSAMLMMCLAVLAVALSLLWPALARGFRHLCLPRRTLTRITPLRSLRLGNGPPPVWQFSVIRC